MLHRELNSYADAGSDPAYDDPYTETCPKCEGSGANLFSDDTNAPCRRCDGAGMVECERPRKEDFAEEDVDQ